MNKKWNQFGINGMGKWFGAEEGESDPPTEEQKPEVKGIFTAEQQEVVNKLLAAEKRKQQESAKAVISELETLRKSQNLSAKEKAELTQRIETLQTESLSKEELLKREVEKRDRNHSEQLKQKEQERATWEDRFRKTEIKRAIADAARDAEAYEPSHLEAILGANASLVEELDADGQPTGKFIPKVKFSDRDKEGKPLVLDLTIKDAVKRMADMEEHKNLFKPNLLNGFGGKGSPTGGSGQLTEADVAKMTVPEYEKALADGRLRHLLGE